MTQQTKRRNGLLWAVGFSALLMITGTLISSYRWINRPFPGFLLYHNLVVGPDFLPQWTGTIAGIGFLDRIVAVDGTRIHAPAQAYDLVRRSPPGFPFQYTVERKDQRLQITIPSMTFSFHDWLLSFGIYLLAAVGFLAIGVMPLYLHSPAPSARPLFFMVTMIFLWFSTTYDFMTTQILPKEIRVLAFMLTPSAGIHLGLLLTGTGERQRGRLYLPFIYGLSVCLALYYSLTFYGPLEAWHWALRAGYGYSCVASLVFLTLLWAALKHPISHLERSRLRVVLVGAVAGFFLPTFGAVLRAFFGWQIPHNFLLILAVFFPLSVAYALLKYSLFDIGVVLKVALSRGALTGLLLLVYISVVSLLSLLTGIYEKDVLVPLFFAVLVVLIFNPLLRWLEGVVDRYVYGQEYDPAELQSDVSLLLRSLSRPEATARRFLQIIANRVGIDTAFLCFRNSEGANTITVSVRRGHFEEGNHCGDLSSFWQDYLAERRRGLFKGEVETDPAHEGHRAEALRLFQELEAELLIPIIFEDKSRGFVSLGTKRSGREYSASDHRLLCNLADQLALSLENGMLYDQSERTKESYRLLYNDAQILNQKLVETDRSKKEFVANISHELRTPISTILGYAEVLVEQKFAGDAHTILERVVRSGHDLSELIDSLLDFSRVEAGTLGVIHQEVNLREILQSLETMVSRLLKGRQIRFSVRLQSVPERIETDPKKLQQILMHLLTNALKFTERGEIALEVRAARNEAGSYLELSVSDTGIGISKQDQEIIFEDFRQLDGSSTRRYGGTGLGLGLCRKLSWSLGGKITLESEIGKGSVFSLFLPLQSPQTALVSTLSVV